MTPQTYLQGMVYGGDFEDPGWTTAWSQIWMGAGRPARTSLGSPGLAGIVLRGSNSIWLGGSASNDLIAYPLSFPRNIDSTYASGLSFLLNLQNADVGYDYFCIAVTDASGNILGNGTEQLRACTDQMASGTQLISFAFSAATRQLLAGQTGYLNLYTIGNGLAPHMSAFVDEIALGIDFPNVTLQTVPGAGPAGTTFMFVGSNNVPYGSVEVCVSSCALAANVLGTAYADARGDLRTYLRTGTSAVSGTYTIETRNLALRTAQNTLTILGAQPPSLSASPATGVAGTAFFLTGTNLLPNDAAISVRINGSLKGTVGSNRDGVVSFRYLTTSNTGGGPYVVNVTDSGGRSATANLQVTAVASTAPTLGVTPPTGAPGSTFTPKVTDLDDSNFLLATPRVVSCTEGARVQPEGPPQAAHDALTRLLHRMEPATLPLWREAEPLVDRTRGRLISDDPTLDTPDAQEIARVHHQWSGNHRRVVPGINRVSRDDHHPAGGAGPHLDRLWRGTPCLSGVGFLGARRKADVA